MTIRTRKYNFARSRPEPLSPAPVVYGVQFEVKLKMAVALLSEMSHPHGDPNSGAHREQHKHKRCLTVELIETLLFQRIFVVVI